MAITGASAYVKYGYESSFKTVASANKIFGVNQKINRSESNNLERGFTLGQRYAATLISKAFDGTITMDFVLSNPWFLRGIFGNAPVHAAGTPDLWYFVDTGNINGGGAKNIQNIVPSITIENALDRESNPNQAVKNKFLGCVVDSCTITAAQNEVVKVSLDMLFADASYDVTNAYVPGTVADTYDPFIYADGCVKIGTDSSGAGGTSIANVTNVELTFKNNAELLKSICARSASAKLVKQFECDIKMTVLFDLTKDLIEKFYGVNADFSTIPNTGAINTTLKLEFDNGLSGDNQRSIVFVIENVKFGENVLNQVVEDPVAQELTIMGTRPTLVMAKNADTTEP